MNKTSEGLNIEYIPANFKEGTSALGMIIKPAYIAQALPFVAVVVIFLLTVGRNWDFVVRLIIFLIVCSPVVIVAAVGIRGDSLYTFLRNYVRMKKSARVLVYKKEVKPESRRVDEYERGQTYETRDKLIAMMSKIRKEDSTEEEYNFLDEENIIFQEDIESRNEKKGKRR